MQLHHYKRVPDYKVEEWLLKAVELSPYQKSKLFQDETIRFAPFKFFERRKTVNSIWWRLTIFPMPVVWVLFFIFMPINFLATGRWGYSNKTIGWYMNWADKVGI